MKQILKRGIAWALMLAMLTLCAAGCAKDPAPGEDTSDTESSVAIDSQAPVSTEPQATEPPVETEGEAIAYTLKSMAVVRSSDDLAKTAAQSLYTLLKANGHRVDRPVSDTDTAVAGAEFLVGDTNREISTALKARLTADNQYLISFQKEGIVIVAIDTLALTDAVTYFMETYVPQAVDGVLTINENHTYVGKTNFVEMATADTVHYKVVYSFSEDTARQSAKIIADRLAAATKLDVACVDDMETFGENDKLILVGTVSEEKFPKATELRRDWALPEYGVIFEDGTIYVSAMFGTSIEDAAYYLVQRISNQSRITDGKLVVSIPDLYRDADDSYLVDFPQFVDAKLSSYDENTNSELVYNYTKVTSEQYEAYVDTLVKDGFRILNGEEHTIGRNRFATCIKDDEGQVHVAFYPDAKGTGNLQLFASKLDEVVAIPEETYDPATEKITETTFHVLSLDYTTGAYATGKRLCDGSGMSYAVTLEDGRFVVFDGGYTAQDGENLYQYLKAMNKRPDGKIVIAAWFISHPHDDHTGGFEAFVAKHAKEVTMEYLVVSAPTEERYGGKHWMITDMPSVMAPTGAKLIKPHVGQVLTFCNTEFEIIMTQDVVSATGVKGDGNNSSTVVRMWEKGTSIMISADASVASCNRMVALFGDALKSDIFQLNHHGVSGGTLAFYQKVAPTYALWTTSQDSFAGHDDPNANCGYSNCVGRTGRINGGGNSAGSAEQANCNKFIRDSVGIENCYVADDQIEWITFTEEGPVFTTETGYFVDNRVGTFENEGVLQMPASSEE